MEYNELKCLLADKITEANTLLAHCCQELISRGVDGALKLKRKIQVERDNLVKFEANPDCRTVHRLNGSNLHHYQSLCKMATSYDGVVAVLSPFRRRDNSIVYVDIVAENGSAWVKVVARNARGLHFSFTGESYSKEKNVTYQAVDYLEAAQNNLYHYNLPTIIFEFTGGLTEPIRRRLVKIGIQPKGEIVHVPISYMDDDSSNEDDNEFVDVNPEKSSLDRILPSCNLNHKNTVINLDVTALFAFVSNLTNGHANYLFKSPMLNNQAQFEREKPALPYLRKITDGRQLICCKTAYNAFMDILDTVGGPNERNRAELFMKNVKIIDDGCTDNFSQLRSGPKIKERSKVIFGSGDYYHAITLTANRSFVLSAESQGMKLAIIIHESRALSEQKQQEALPIT